MKRTGKGAFRKNAWNRGMRGVGFLSALLVFLMIPTSGAGAWASSFSADMVKTSKSGISTNRFFMRDQQYRMETEEEGMALVILVDRKRGLTRMVVPDEKVYLEFKNDNMRSLMNNPFEAYVKLAGMTRERTAGTETVEGIPCRKNILSENGEDLMVACLAETLDFPLRIDNLGNAEKVELKNIRETSLKDALFQVPDGYELVDAMPFPLPEWAGDAARAPVMTPPFDKVLEEGQMVRIRPREGYAVTVKGSSPEGGKGTFTSVAFRKGRPLTDPSTGTFNVSGGSSIQTRHKQGPGDADHVVVRAGQGHVAIKAGFEALPPEGVMVEEFSIRANYRKEFELDRQKASRVYVTDVSGDGKGTRGIVDIYTSTCREVEGGTYCQPRETGKEDLALDNGKTRMWEFEEKQHISHMRIEILSGGVDVRTELPRVAGGIPPSWKQGAVKESSMASPEKKTGKKPEAGPGEKGQAMAKTGKPPALPQTKEEARALREQAGQQADAGFMNGEVPLFEGARVIESKSHGSSASAQFQASAGPQEVIDFYSKEMPKKGWTQVMAMVRGPQGVATFMQSGRQLVIKAVGQGDASTVSLGIVGQ